MSTRLPFKVKVEGIGEFTFRHADMADQVGIEARALRITGGETTDKELSGWAIMLARLEVLTEEAPVGWDLAGIDPEEPEETIKIILVHGRLMEERDRFRAAAKARRVPPRTGDVPNASVPVPPPVQSPAN